MIESSGTETLGFLELYQGLHKSPSASGEECGGWRQQGKEVDVLLVLKSINGLLLYLSVSKSMAPSYFGSVPLGIFHCCPQGIIFSINKNMSSFKIHNMDY